MRLGKEGAWPGGPPTMEEDTRPVGLLQRQARDRRLRLRLDLRLALAVATPPRLDEAEPLAVRHDLAKLAIVCDGVRPALAERQSLVVERALNLLQQRVHTLGHACHGARLLGLAVRARHEDYLLVLVIAGADLDAHRHATQLPVVERAAGALLAPVGSHAHARGPWRTLDIADDRPYPRALFRRSAAGHDDWL